MSRILEVIIGLKRNSAMAIASIVLIFLTLFILGFSVIIMENVGAISSSIIEDLSMYVYVDTDISASDEDKLIEDVKAIPEVGEVTLSTKKEELESVTQFFGKEGDELKTYFEGDKNPLNDVLEVKAVDDEVDLESLSIQIGAMEGVEDVDYGADMGANQLIQGLKGIQLGANIACVILTLITVFLIINTIKLTITSRRKEIEIMRLVGATKTYITFPFAVEGMILGLVGGLISFGITYYVYMKIYYASGPLITVIVAPESVKISLIIAQVAFGVIIGLISSTIAIRNYLKV